MSKLVFPGQRGVHYWNSDEIRWMKLQWGERTLIQIANDLGRAAHATWMKSRQLKLPSVPSGYIYIKELGEIVGFDRKTILKVVKKAKVKLWPVWSYPHRAQKTKKRIYIVRQAQATAKITAYLNRVSALETPSMASKRTGHDARLIRRWAEKMGMILHYSHLKPGVAELSAEDMATVTNFLDTTEIVWAAANRRKLTFGWLTRRLFKLGITRS